MSSGGANIKHIIIASSVLNKFNDWPVQKLLDFIAQVDSRATHDQQLAAGDLLADVKLQLECFRRIEAIWFAQELSFDVLMSINALVTGENQDQAVFRTREHVKDFGGPTPTELASIPAGISLVEEILVRLEKAVQDPEPPELANVLAEAFCSIINVHPFEDGNGRTARFLVQLALLKAGYEYVELPKYRNDIEWRKALDLGTQRDFSAAAAFLQKRLYPRKAG